MGEPGRYPFPWLGILGAIAFVLIVGFGLAGIWMALS